MTPADKALLTNIQKFLTNNDNNLLIANRDKIFVEDNNGGKIYQKDNEGKTWKSTDFKGNLIEEFDLKDVEVNRLTQNLGTLLTIKKKKNANTSEKIAKFISEFFYLEKKNPNYQVEEEMKQIGWVDNAALRMDYVSDVLLGMKFKNRYEDCFKNWRAFSIWKMLYEENKVNLLDEIKKINGCSGTEAGKPIIAVTRFDQYFELLPEGSYVYCTIPVTYFKHCIKEDWDSLIVKFKKYKGGETSIFDEYNSAEV